jgi:GntR family transcriptional regulator
MTPFGMMLRPGQSIFDQLVSAAQKAILSGELVEGQDFPSLRTLAVELKIHPNTAHKAVQYLIQERWLEKRPGIGTVVAPAPNKLAEMRRQLMQKEIAELVAEARRVGLGADDLKSAVDAEWEKTAGMVRANR